MPPRYRGIGQALAALAMVAGAVQVVTTLAEVAEDLGFPRKSTKQEEEYDNGYLRY